MWSVAMLRHLSVAVGCAPTATRALLRAEIVVMLGAANLNRPGVDLSRIMACAAARCAFLVAPPLLTVLSHPETGVKSPEAKPV